MEFSFFHHICSICSRPWPPARHSSIFLASFSNMVVHGHRHQTNPRKLAAVAPDVKVRPGQIGKQQPRASKDDEGRCLAWTQQYRLGLRYSQSLGLEPWRPNLDFDACNCCRGDQIRTSLLAFAACSYNHNDRIWTLLLARCRRRTCKLQRRHVAMSLSVQSVDVRAKLGAVAVA